MARGLTLAIALSLMGTHGTAEVTLQQRGERLDLAAARAPVAEVLDRLARQTGMKVVYDGVPPRQLVNVTVHDRTPAEAVADVLEGLGVNYALIADPTGVRVQTLMVLSRPATATAAGTPGGPMPARAPEPNSHRAYVPPGGMPPDELGEDQNAADDGALVTPPEAAKPPQGPLGQPPANVAPQQFPVSPFAPQPGTTAPMPGAVQPFGGLPPLQSPGMVQPPATQPQTQPTPQQ